MARVVKPLSAKKVANAKPKDKKYKLSDDGGLFSSKSKWLKTMEAKL